MKIIKYIILIFILINPPSIYAIENTTTIQQCLPIRAFVIHPRYKEQLEFNKELIKLGVENNFNTIIIETTSWIKYPDLPTSYYNKDKLYDPEDILQLVQYAKAQKLEVIPSLWLLTHQEIVARQYYPDIMLNEQTIDPNNPKSWEFEKKLLDDTINLYHPKKF